MFKKNYLVLSLIIAALFVSGCSSKKKKRRATPEGTVVFFQNIEGTAPLNLKALNTNERNSYGTVGFQQFTFGVSLKVGDWEVEAVENKTGDQLDDDPLATGEFSVVKDELSLVAITGNDGEAKGKVIQLPLAKRNGERSINVSHLYKDLGEVDAYFSTEAGCDVDDFDFTTGKLVSGLAFGKSSKTLSLPISEDNKNICIQVKQADEIVYTSGKVYLDDKNNQTLLLTKNTNSLASGVSEDDKIVNLIYYRQGQIAVWSDIDHQIAQVRVLNLLDDGLTDVQAELLIDQSVEAELDDIGGISAPPNLSDYKELASGSSYFLEAKRNNISLSAPRLAPLSGQQLTVAYFNNDPVKTMTINEVQNLVDGRLQITISTPMFLGTNDPSRFNVYLLSDEEYEFNQPKVTLSARSTSTFDVELKDYQLIITDGTESEVVKLADLNLNVDDKAENKHIILYKEGGGFELCEINDADKECK